MNGLWQNIEQTVTTDMPMLLSSVVAQATPPSTDPSTPASSPISPILSFFQSLGLGPILVSLLGAIAILLIGWIIASLIAAGVGSLLRRTDVDNQLASWVTGRSTQEAQPNVETWASALVFWIIMILAIVAALNALNLTTVSQPLNSFLGNIFAYLPKLGGAAILIGVAWVVATLTKEVVTRTARSFGLDDKLQPADTPPEGQFLLSETLGNALYWFIFLFFLPLILGVLDLQGPLQPVQNLLNDVLAALPKLLKAGLIGVVGWLIARVVRGIVSNLLAATGADQVGAQFGLNRSRGGQSLSWLAGTLVYVLILIPTATATLDALEIPAISRPATSMLNQILSALPQIFTAGLILVAAYVIGRFVGDLVSNILAGIGFNNIFYWLGVQSTPSTPPPFPPETGYTMPPEGQQTVIQDPGVPVSSTRTPSEIVGIVVLIAILLFATVAATNILNVEGLTLIVTGLLLIFGRILAGLVVFAVGLYLANLAFTLITSSGSSQARILAQAARIAIITLVSAMALQQMGIAPNIVNLAFGLLLGAVAVAIALAFGLGGRDIAAEQTREWLSSFKQRNPPH
jgi:hypothetical protein